MDSIFSLVFDRNIFIPSVALIVGVILYMRATKEFDFFTSQGIKGPRPVPFLGNYIDAFTRSTLLMDIQRREKYGKIYGYFHGSKPVLSVGDPVLLKKILVKDFNIFTDRNNPPHNQTLKTTMFFLPGQEWKRVRNICSPAFTSLKIKNGLNLMKNCLDSVMNNLQESTQTESKEVDCKKLFGAFTLDVIASSAFGTNIDTHKDPDNLFAKNLKGFFTISFWRMIILLSLPKVAAYFDITFTSPKSMQFFEAVVTKIIQDRKQNPGNYSDLLQQLMDAEYDSKRVADDISLDTDKKSEQTNNRSNETLIKRQESQEMSAVDKKLTEFEIFCQSFIFLLAGYETTANLLTHAVYSLALHPEYQERLHKEILSIGGTNISKQLEYEELQKMPFLEGVLYETLRLYSPLFRLDRTAQKDYFDSETGIKIPKGTAISIPIHAIHRDPDFYPDPETFNPERFLPENKGSLVQYTWLPFGSGPRNCIGMRFALLEAKLALAEMVRKYQFFRTDNTDVPLQHPTFQAIFSAKRVVVGVKDRDCI